MADQEDNQEKIAQISAKLSSWFKHTLSDYEDIAISNFSSPDIGYSSETLLFDLQYCREGEAVTESLVIRMEPQGIRLFSRYDLSLQYRIMQALADSPVPVPTMRWFEADSHLFGSPFYVMNRVEGVVPADNPPYHMQGWLHEQAPEQRRQIWLNAITAMANIHRLDYRDYDLAFLDEPELGTTPIEQHINLYEQHIEWGLDRSRFPLLDIALQWLRTHLPTDEPSALTWGDARICNIIFQDCDVVSVLDWEMARLGNPVQDLGFWLVLDSCMSDGISIPRLENLPNEQETIAHWEAQSGHQASASDLLFYKIFAAFCFTFIMARLMTREKLKGTLPEDDNFDRDNMASQSLSQLLTQAGVII